MYLKHTQIKENNPRNIFFLVEEEAEIQRLSDKRRSRKKNKGNLWALGEKKKVQVQTTFFLFWFGPWCDSEEAI